MKKQIASGLIGLLALGGAAGIAAPVAFAQDDDAAQERVLTQDQIDQKLDRLADAVESGHITQAQADEMTERIESGDFVGRHGRHGNRGAKLMGIADTIGIDADELRAGFQAGQSLAEIAEASGVSVDSLIDSLVDQANEHIDAKVADGTLDADDAAEKRSNIEERITERINRTPGQRGHNAPEGA